MSSVQLLIIGGFLGSGKTTSILTLGRKLKEANKKVAIVTNDQTSHLVDSEYIKSQGFPVLEVTSGCFCCHFHDFVDQLDRLSKDFLPDVILAEPVGSCTDLISTIIKPIKRFYDGRFTLSPLSVVVDPIRLEDITSGYSAFQKEVSYLFLKQLEEADILVLNKIDLLSQEQINKHLAFLRSTYPNTQLICTSSLEETGTDDWLNKIALTLAPEKPSLQIVYDTYATAEAALGWLNFSCKMTAVNFFDGNEFLQSLADTVQKNLYSNRMEIAHFKMCFVSSTDFAKLSCVGMAGKLSLDKQMSEKVREGNLIINIRADCQPYFLKNLTENELNALTSRLGIEISQSSIDCFSPAYPQPVHRL